MALSHSNTHTHTHHTHTHTPHTPHTQVTCMFVTWAVNKPWGRNHKPALDKLVAYLAAVHITDRRCETDKWPAFVQVQIACQMYQWRESAMIRTARTYVYCGAITGGPDSSVGTAAFYILDGAWIESR